MWAAPAPGSGYDQLTVSGTATLGGTLNVSLLNGFTPELPDNYTVLTASSVSGTFGTASLPSFAGRTLLGVNYHAANVALSVTTEIVTNSADSGRGSLRQAITDTNNAVGTNFIYFDISGTAPFTIAPRLRCLRSRRR